MALTATVTAPGITIAVNIWPIGSACGGNHRRSPTAPKQNPSSTGLIACQPDLPTRPANQTCQPDNNHSSRPDKVNSGPTASGAGGDGWVVGCCHFHCCHHHHPRRQ